MKERRYLPYLFCLTVLVCIAAFTPSALAATGTVTGKVVNLRTGPGASYHIASQLGQGTKVLILTSKSGWDQVQLNNGRQGWMNSKYIKSSSVTVTSAMTTTKAGLVPVRVTGSIVNLRKAPSISSAIIGRCQKGDVLTWKKTLTGWYQVVTKAGKTVYISSSLAIIDKKTSQTSSTTGTTTSTSVINLPTPTTANSQQSNLIVTASVVNLRSGPGTEYPMAGQVKMNQTLNADKVYGGWYRVAFAGKQAWIADDLVQLLKPMAITPSRNSVDRSAAEIVNLGLISTDAAGQEALELKASAPISIAAGVTGSDGLQRWAINGLAVASSLTYGSGTGYEGLQITPQGPEQAEIRLQLRTGYQINLIQVDPQTYRFYFQSESTLPNLNSPTTIVVDPGHGGSDPGAMYFNANEKDLNLAMGLKLGQALEQAGYHVVYTRNEDSAVSLTNRCQIANNTNAALFVSIHCNASTNKELTGTTTYYCAANNSSMTKERLKLSSAVQSSLISSLGTSSKGVRTERFQVLRDTNIPSILVETAFMSNSQDFTLLSNEDQQWVIARAITQGITNYLSVE